MPLSTEVVLGPGEIVLDGDPGPPKRGTAPNFWLVSIVAKWLPSHLLLTTCNFIDYIIKITIEDYFFFFK